MSTKKNSPHSDNKIVLPSQHLTQVDAEVTRQYLQYLVKNMNDSIIIINKNLEIILLNDITVERSKKYLDPPLQIGISALNFVKPERHEMLKDLFESIFTGITIERESAFIFGDHEKFYQSNFRPIYNLKDEIVAALIISVDITEKKLNEERIKKSEEQYRLLFASNPLPAWIFDMETLQFLEINKAAIQFYGYSKEEFLSMKITDIRPEEDIDALYADLERMGNEKHFQKDVWRHYKKNGELVHVEIFSDSIVYEQRPARLVMVNDVSEKIESEAELIKSNERFLLASKATSDAIWDWDMEKDEIKWGEGLFTLFGYYGKGLSSDFMFQHIHDEDREFIKESLEESINNPEVTIWRNEYRLLHARGHYRYVLDNRFIVRNNDKKAIRSIGAMKDITELKEKERDLLFLNERFNLVTKATTDLIWDWNLQTGEIYRDLANLQKVYGVEDNDEINNINKWIKRIHPNDLERVQQTIDKILHSKTKEIFEIEYRFLMDDQTYTHVYDRGYIMRNEKQEPYRMIGAVQNISVRKRLEEKLLHEELNSQKIISQAVIDTQEKERSEISKELHDNVNQVLTTTKLYLDLASANNELTPELIAKSSKNVIYVINEIRQLSHSLILPSLGDLGLMDSIKDLIENINATNQLEVTFIQSDFNEDLLEDNQKLMLFRITQEGLNNILRHSAATLATVHMMQDSKKIRLMIRDDGKGFDSNQIKPGAGLNNIRNRVYLFNGNLYIHSSHGKGCELIIDIPLQKK